MEVGNRQTVTTLRLDVVVSGSTEELPVFCIFRVFCRLVEARNLRQLLMDNNGQSTIDNHRNAKTMVFGITIQPSGTS